VGLYPICTKLGLAQMNVFALHGQDTFQVSRSGRSRSKIAVCKESSHDVVS
jgi:hypothetical protein